MQGVFNWLWGLNKDGHITSRSNRWSSSTKAKSDQRRAEDLAQRQAEREQNAALNAARDAFLEQNQIRQYDPKKTYREMELVYKNAGGPGFLGLSYKDYHVFRNGKIIHVRYYGNFNEKNFKSKKAFEVFKLGGGNAMLRGKANYDVKKVLELGFNAATAKLKPQNAKQRAPQSTENKTVQTENTNTIPNPGISGDKATLWKRFYQMERTQEQSILS